MELKDKQSGQNEKQFEQNDKLSELKAKQFEQNYKPAEQKVKQMEINDKPSDQMDKPSELKEKQQELNDKPAEQIDKPSDLKEKQIEIIDKPSEQIDKPTELKEKQYEVNEKPSDQIDKPTELKEKQFEPSYKQSEHDVKQSDLREKQFEQNEKQPDQVDKPIEIQEKQSGQNYKQFEQNDKLSELKSKQFDQTEKPSEDNEKQFFLSDGLTTSLDTSFDSLDNLESKMETGLPNCKTNATTAPEPKKPKCEQKKCQQNAQNASENIIIRSTRVMVDRKASNTKTTKVGSMSTTISTTKSTKIETTSTKEFTEPKTPAFDEGETVPQATTTKASSSFFGKLKTATLKFFDSVTQRPRHPQKSSTSTVTTTSETTMTTRAIDKISSTETDPMYFDDTQITTRMSPTIVIINEYDNQINSEILNDPNKDADGYRNLLLSIIQYETNKLNDEWHRIAYGDPEREEVGYKRSVSQISRVPPTTTTKPKKKPKPKQKVITAPDEEYDLIEGMKALKNLELPEPTAKPHKPEGLLNKIVNKMGIKVVAPEKKQAVKKPTVREVGSRKKLNRKRRLKLNSWKMDPPTMPVTESL